MDSLGVKIVDHLLRMRICLCVPLPGPRIFLFLPAVKMDHIQRNMIFCCIRSDLLHLLPAEIGAFGLPIPEGPFRNQGNASCHSDIGRENSCHKSAVALSFLKLPLRFVLPILPFFVRSVPFRCFLPFLSIPRITWQLLIQSGLNSRIQKQDDIQERILRGNLQADLRGTANVKAASGIGVQQQAISIAADIKRVRFVSILRIGRQRVPLPAVNPLSALVERSEFFSQPPDCLIRAQQKIHPRAHRRCPVHVLCRKGKPCREHLPAVVHIGIETLIPQYLLSPLRDRHFPEIRPKRQLNIIIAVYNMARLVRRPNFRMRPPYSGISVLCLYAVKIKDRISFFFFRKCEHFQSDRTVRQKFRTHCRAPVLCRPHHQDKTVSLLLDILHIDEIILPVRK